MKHRVLGLIPIYAAILCAAAPPDGWVNREGSAGVPVLGYAWSEQSLELRAILGIPGAARWSDPVALPAGTLAARIAPGHKWALILRKEGEAGILRLDGSLAFTPIAEPLHDVSGVLFSPSGSAILLPAGTVFTGLPDAPQRAGSVEPGDFTAAAISDGGEVAMVDAGRNLRIGRDSLTGCSEGCRFAFLPGPDARLVLFRDGALAEVSRTDFRWIAATPGVTAPVALQPFENSILLASESSLLWIDRAFGTVRRMDPNPSPGGRLDAMFQAGCILLSTSWNDNEVAWMFSPDGVSFVPARPLPPADDKEGKE